VAAFKIVPETPRFLLVDFPLIS